MAKMYIPEPNSKAKQTAYLYTLDSLKQSYL
jgi:hypothetical protein